MVSFVFPGRTVTSYVDVPVGLVNVPEGTLMSFNPKPENVGGKVSDITVEPNVIEADLFPSLKLKYDPFPVPVRSPT